MPIPDLVGSAYSVESASRAALALDTKAFLLQAVEKPAMETAMAEGASGPGSCPASGPSSEPDDGSVCDVSLLLMVTHCSGTGCNIGTIS
ncbi:MAG: hypothetical protein ACRDYE_04245 [Acidimicrobiales bacterium]